MKRFTLALFLLLFAPQAPSFGFTPSTLFTVAVIPTVSYNTNTGRFTFRYSVSNSYASQQSIGDFGIAYKVKDFQDVSTPPDWSFYPNFSRRAVALWGADENANAIHPGQSRSNIVLSSAQLPAIQTYYARSTYIYSPATDEEEDEVIKGILTYFFNNCQTNKTIGPSMSKSTEPHVIVSYIEDQKHQCLELGWITSSGAIISLDKKLAAAKSSIVRGQYKTAENQVQAFNHELEALKGKHVNQAAYSLLSSTSSYLLTLLH